MAIGTGHVMRQIALAQHLISQEVETFLFASISGPSWLRRYVKTISGLNWVEAEELDYSPGLFQPQQFDAILVDSYAPNSLDLRKLESVAPRVAIVLDGAWQNISGMVGIVPTLDPLPPGLSDMRRRFAELHVGPQFIMLRSEVFEAARLASSRPKSRRPHVVLALGGSDSGHLTEQIIALLELDFGEISVFGNFERTTVSKSRNSMVTITRKPAGVGWLPELATASLAIVGAGTSVAEVGYLRTPALFVAVAENQWSNAIAAERLGLGKSVFSHLYGWEKRLSRLVGAVLQESGASDRQETTSEFAIDSKGANRVHQVLAGGAHHFGACHVEGD
jgi:spore coat polysaccharide biosynthesis predicted glycosyltransferase SpsG